MKKQLINYLCLTGILSLIFYILHDIIGFLNYPGYDWMSRAVSDLTATDSPSFVVASGYITVYKIFSCICCACICILIKNEKKTLRIGVYLFSIMNFISAIGYALFPLTSAGYDGTFQSFIHVYVLTIIVVLLSIISLIIIGIGAIKTNKKTLGTLALITLALMFIGVVGSQNASKEIFGIFERFSTYSIVIYTTILGINCYKIKEN